MFTKRHIATKRCLYYKVVARKRERMVKGFEDRGYLRALLEGLLVTFLWSTSFVLNKIGLSDIPPLTFAAYRYMIASAILFAFSLPGGKIGKFAVKKKHMLKFLILGVAGYSVAQGLQYVGLFHLPAVTVTFLLNFTPVLVLLLGLIFLQESPTPLQLAGMALALLGAYFFFSSSISGVELTGIVITLLSGLGWAVYMVGSRQVLTKDELKPLSLTFFPMVFGAVLLLFAAMLAEHSPTITINGWIITLWLSLVNTALAFLLWNHALKRVEAFKLSILQNTMLIQIAILAWIFLGEELTPMKLVAMGMVFIGVLLVQITRKKT